MWQNIPKMFFVGKLSKLSDRPICFLFIILRIDVLLWFAHCRLEVKRTWKSWTWTQQDLTSFHKPSLHEVMSWVNIRHYCKSCKPGNANDTSRSDSFLNYITWCKVHHSTWHVGQWSNIALRFPYTMLIILLHTRCPDWQGQGGLTLFSGVKHEGPPFFCLQEVGGMNQISYESHLSLKAYRGCGHWREAAVFP